MLESLSPGQTDLAALALVLAVAGQLSCQSLRCQRADTAEVCPTERTGPGLAVAGVTGEVAVITLPYPGWRTGQVTHGTLQHLPGGLHHSQGGLHFSLSQPRSLSGLTVLSSTAVSSLLQDLEESLERPREISPQTH